MIKRLCLSACPCSFSSIQDYYWLEASVIKACPDATDLVPGETDPEELPRPELESLQHCWSVQGNLFGHRV